MTSKEEFIVNVIFIGCVESSAVFLKTLLEEKADIVGVITKEESKQNSDFVDLSVIASQNGIPYIYVKNINECKTFKFIKEKNADIGFCLGWSQLLGKELLDLFPWGVIGFHPAALPRNRGRHPLIWALALGLDETASSFFIMDESADTGALVSQKQVPILYEDTARSLYDKIMDTAKIQLQELWRDICKDHVTIMEESGQQGNTWRKRNRSDGKIDWRMSGRSIYNLVRALSEPYIGAHFEYEGHEYKIWETRELENSLHKNIEPGKILDVNEENHFIIQTGNGLIEVIRYDKTFVPRVGKYL